MAPAYERHRAARYWLPRDLDLQRTLLAPGACQRLMSVTPCPAASWARAAGSVVAIATQQGLVTLRLTLQSAETDVEILKQP